MILINHIIADSVFITYTRYYDDKFYGKERFRVFLHRVLCIVLDPTQQFLWNCRALELRTRGTRGFQTCCCRLSYPVQNWISMDTIRYHKCLVVS